MEINKTNLQPYLVKGYEIIVFVKDLVTNKNTDMKQFKKLRGKLVNSQNKELQHLMYDRRVGTKYV